MLPRTTPQGPFPIQHAFVVQFAAETTLDATGIMGRVEHLVSGQATRFQSVEALFAFMAARLQEIQQSSTAGEAAEQHLQDQSLAQAARPEATLRPRSGGLLRSANAVAEAAHVDAATRRYGIPAGHAEVLLERDSLNYLVPLGRFTIGVLSGLTRVLEAFKTGGGIAYPDYGVDARAGQAEANRTAFINLLGAQWLPAIPDLHARLQADPPARVADIACGTGWSSLALARAYPKYLDSSFFTLPLDGGG